MKRSSKTGIGKIIQDDAVQQPEHRRKKRGLGDKVGLGLLVRREVWVALHERAIHEGATITQMVTDWLNEKRASDGLPPV